ncbi:tRNA (adenosine(37)-N6)-threonylcarbamoyltransferase complex dimerization subunit type 1 TsaB [Corynebacterium sp. HMSC29G08]|uniref:tRNA (adenosine(37)-N6)-threonylcarbamoyltransferase complex dimerization subunit type 1 TsaB n=1 Tax=Corynebacterium sp. HMSC29G08 TaxID=1581069 RepID=UPI0008A36547|nr:tRNA (adenosine(37)-N6)-threonylcarbamoyltransferase complex dimerization subunit type 1 TsaB [Corynebacterium sp. HMSC29G08]OFT82269.1 tRNA threonylcarbamoyladenosine biosynthesis protein TsaB [Corynebacterium sp. HMSC29G08]
MPDPKFVLAIDTATAELVVGVAKRGKDGALTVLAESAQATRAHNELLVPTVEAMLRKAGVTYADLDAVVVGCGPGPFTGLRVGMASASAFAQALKIPVYGVVTHDATGLTVEAPSCLVVTDARRREVYWAHYERGTRVAGPDVCAPSAVTVESVDVLSCPLHLRDQLQVAAGEVTYLGPRTAGLIAAADFTAPPAPLVPLYLRRPDAVPPK